MSIVFILYGVFLICVSFNIVNGLNKIDRIFLLFVLNLFLISYFFDFTLWSNVYFNSIQIFVALNFLLYFIVKKDVPRIKILLFSLSLISADIKFQISEYTYAICDMEPFFDSIIVFEVVKLILKNFFSINKIYFGDYHVSKNYFSNCVFSYCH